MKPGSALPAALYLRYAIRHALNHLRGHFGIDRQGQALPGRSFANRQITGLIAKALKARLQVEGNGVVHLAPDSLSLKMVHQSIAARMPDHNLVVDMLSDSFL